MLELSISLIVYFCLNTQGTSEIEECSLVSEVKQTGGRSYD